MLWVLPGSECMSCRAVRVLIPGWGGWDRGAIKLETVLEAHGETNRKTPNIVTKSVACHDSGSRDNRFVFARVKLDTCTHRG